MPKGSIAEVQVTYARLTQEVNRYKEKENKLIYKVYPIPKIQSHVFSSNMLFNSTQLK